MEDFFDLLTNTTPRRIFKACGEIGKGKKAKRCEIFVQATTENIAKRVGKRWLSDVHKAKFVCVIPYTWAEYAEVMRRAGFQIGPPLERVR